MRRLIKFIIPLIISTVSYAEDTSRSNLFFSGGLSINEGEFYKWGQLEYETDLYKFWDQKVVLGGWFDSNGGNNTSAYTFYQVGMGPEWQSFYVKTWTGIGLISNPDYRLGSYYQFSEEVTAGIRDDNGISFGLIYKHISNAGIKQPNAGRDMIGLRLSIDF